MIHNREIFKVGVLSNANSIIVGHNHPSGELEPSSQDIEYTKAVIKAGNLLGIEVLYYEDLYYNTKVCNLQGLEFNPDKSKKLSS